MTKLPKNNLDLLKGNHEALKIIENTTAAYWLHGRDDSAALYLLKQIHRDFAQMAYLLGYTIAPKVAPDARADEVVA